MQKLSRTFKDNKTMQKVWLYYDFKNKAKKSRVPTT